MTIITEEDVEACWPAYLSYITQLLNGEYDLQAAQEDIRSLIGSKYDPRETP